jgi:hypothetical protein
MKTHSDNEKAEDTVSGKLISMREPPGRLGAIVRRLKQLAPQPPRIAAEAAETGEE